MGTAGKDRQAAFKARMREEGKKQITVWVDAEQEKQIKVVLAGNAPAATPAPIPALKPAHSLPVTHGAFVMPAIPAAMPESTRKEINESLALALAKKKHTQIDNNPVENAIRPIAIGKKNWLFAGSERAGKRAAAIQSLLATARLNGLDPAAWLRDTLEKLPTCLNSQIDSLLPLRHDALHHPAS